MVIPCTWHSSQFIGDFLSGLFYLDLVKFDDGYRWFEIGLLAHSGRVVVPCTWHSGQLLVIFFSSVAGLCVV